MGLDSARDAFVSLYGAKTFQLPLTGPFISIAPVTTGPWYWIQLIFARLLIPTSHAPWLLLGIYATVMIFVMYRIGDLLHGHLFGLILALITALSPGQIRNATGLTNPAVIGFYAGIIMYLFLILFKKGNRGLTGFILGLILGVTINTHYQSVSLLSLPLTLLYFRKKYIKTLIFMIIGIFITFIPLLIFELNNHWYNFRGLYNYITVDQYKIYLPTNWRIYTFDFWPQFLSYVFGGGKLFGLSLMLLISAVFSWRIIKGKVEKYQWLILISFIIEVIIIRYYRGEKYFGYLQFFHPYLIYFIGIVFYSLFKSGKTVFVGILAGIYFLYNVLPASIEVLVPEQLTVDTLKAAREIREKFGPGPYKLYKCQELVKPEVNAMVLTLEMNGMYNEPGSPLIYFWGCKYPEIIIDGKMIVTGINTLENPNFPGIDRFRNASQASESAILAAGWKLVTPKGAYQSAARWWFDEQP